MTAPAHFADWMTAHEHTDPKYGHTYRYHSRSDAHSIALCEFVLQDLLAACPVLRDQAERGEVASGINLRYNSPRTRKSKTFDLAIGLPVTGTTPASARGIARVRALGDVLFTCEAKSVMTEHGKSQPRVFDELSSSHEIVHASRPDAIATGLTVVNIARRFASPLRQAVGQPLVFSQHNQPRAAERMITHLRGLPIREGVGQVGFDAYATIVIDCDNQSPATLWTHPPAPQPEDRDSYATFLQRAVRFYTERFSTLPT
jgi:hypothetical protein